VAALQKKLKLVQSVCGSFYGTRTACLTLKLQEATKELNAALDRADVIGRDFVRVVEENKQLKDSMRSNKNRLVLVRLLISFSHYPIADIYHVRTRMHPNWKTISAVRYVP
jgi:hypothetical protein